MLSVKKYDKFERKWTYKGHRLYNFLRNLCEERYYSLCTELKLERLKSELLKKENELRIKILELKWAEQNSETLKQEIETLRQEIAELQAKIDEQNAFKDKLHSKLLVRDINSF